MQATKKGRMHASQLPESLQRLWKQESKQEKSKKASQQENKETHCMNACYYKKPKNSQKLQNTCN